MDCDKKTWAQLVAQRQEQEHKREAEIKAWIASVSERLANERSTFMAEFDENERRIFGKEHA